MKLLYNHYYKNKNSDCNRKNYIRKIFLNLFILFCSAPLMGCTGVKEPLSASAFKLDTIVSLTVYDDVDPQLLTGALELCDYYELIFSRTSPESELFKLNQASRSQALSEYPLSDELAALLRAGLDYSALSGGSFDVTIEPISSLWHFTAEPGGAGEALQMQEAVDTAAVSRIPDSYQIQKALPLIGYEKAVLSGGCITTAEGGMSFDLGAIAKGYIADRIKSYLTENGVKHAIINLGGNVLCIGGRPDGTPFRIGVRQPFTDDNAPAAILLKIKDRSVVTSGIYERCFEEDGVLYHHLLDPSTGYPYDNGIASVTIISDRSVDGDALSTVCFALGVEDSLTLINSMAETEAAFIMADGSVITSGGFSEYTG